MRALTLENGAARADILPALGGRVQRLFDRRSGRQLLFERVATDATSTDFLEATTGGWDLLFPNDSPWGDYPDHGVAWTTPYAVVHATATGVVLEARLPAPPVTIRRSLTLLDGPRVGLRDEVELLAHAPVEHFLFAPHPMLAVATGWTYALPDGARARAADEQLPGRFRRGEPLAPERWSTASRIPPANPPVVEVLYVEGVAEGTLSSPSGEHATRVKWDAKGLPFLWICTVTGCWPGESFALLEPCTTRPFRLEDAIPAGTAASLGTGQTLRVWVELESLDHR